MYYAKNFALITPLANEQDDFYPFVEELIKVLDCLNSGTVYFIVDTVSKDKTLFLCKHLSKTDKRFRTVWAPENRNIVDAYMKGYKVAFQNNHDIIIEMDGGLSHDPKAVPIFLKALNEGYECAFGSRFIHGGSMYNTSLKRKLLSKFGTILSNALLGTSMHDMTSGFQAFHRRVVEQFIDYPFLSTGHFFQTELRYLLRKKRYAEVPIHYRTTSSGVPRKALYNSVTVLCYYLRERISGRAMAIE